MLETQRVQMEPETKQVPDKAVIDILILPRFFCATCFRELSLLSDMMIVYCNSPYCFQYQRKVNIKQELRRISI